MNVFEESPIKNAKLPAEWQSQSDLDDLSEFLQKNWEQRAVFFDDGKIDSKQQFIEFTNQGGVRTKKYIGTIVYKGSQLNIYPKVFRSEAEDQDTDDLSQEHLMTNLVNWIEYCNHVSYPFISMSSEFDDSENLKELFVSLYIGYVKHAIKRGVYYEYVDETADIPFIKGRFDIYDYFSTKVPNGQLNKFRCNYSKFEFDNNVNRIIKYTCKLLLNGTSRKNQKAIRDILIRLNDVADVKCNPNDCTKIRLGKAHEQYRVIICMSKMFLLNQTSSFVMDMDESFCFLFPTDLLFEGFISGFIQDVLEESGGKVSLQKSDMSIIDEIRIDGKNYGKAFTMRHDILVEHKNKIFILDTKYKSIRRFDGDPEEAARTVRNMVEEDDVRQVCDYARKRGTADVYLLYPQYRYEQVDSMRPIGLSSSRNGIQDINIHFIRLPFIFENDVETMKIQLKKIIQDILC